jgi:hypothetical protein
MFCGLVEVLSLQITKKIGSAHCRRSANLTNYLSPQICGFAEDIFGPPISGREHRENEITCTVTNSQLQFNPTTICPSPLAPFVS